MLTLKFSFLIDRSSAATVWIVQKWLWVQTE